MKKWLYTLLVIVLAACSNEIPEQQPAKRSGRTVLAYLISNSPKSLEGNLQDNVVDMYMALAEIKDSCTLLVFYRPQEYSSYLDVPTLLCFDTDGRGNINNLPALTGTDLTFESVCQVAQKKEYTMNSQIATDPVVMEEVLKDMQKIAPSDSYGLILGSHASGWMKGNSVQSKAFGDDDGYNINIPDLADVLKNSFSEKLDFVLFDACMMGTAEVGYELKEITSHCIASVMETPALGFPYKKIFSYLYSENIDYSAVCHEFISFNKVNNAWGTCAVMDCSQMENLASAVKAKLSEWEDALSSVSMQNVQQYGVNSYKYFSYDVLDFFRELGGKSGVAETDLNEAIASIQTVLNEAVIAKECIPNPSNSSFRVDEARFCGIGMYIPKEYNPYVTNKTAWNSYYERSISWYRAAGWADLNLN
ncbi:clostripain-related cysteine peptidase [Phocaeicola plebeius]|uniref:clostripain-related cysteine peptidase n=1 Tax=Phocaeicola plebeius TaxID=310297 RepID=UPI002010F4F8|nr:clostripain-related cysteine peptidase [Phocaeicola plebeius]MCL1613481.1 clostripain-related cysteine peptidase [Phocaeicola plebeius]